MAVYNDQAQERALALRHGGTAHLHAHCRTCNCVAQLSEIKSLGISRDANAHEILEPFYNVAMVVSVIPLWVFFF